eukprot:3271185-Rhodomonas_salina.1
MQVRGSAICLGARYAMSGTELAVPSTSRCQEVRSTVIEMRPPSLGTDRDAAGTKRDPRDREIAPVRAEEPEIVPAREQDQGSVLGADSERHSDSGGASGRGGHVKAQSVQSVERGVQ